MSDQLDDRLRAVERAITDDDSAPGFTGREPVGAAPGAGPAGTAETGAPTETAADRLGDRLDEVEATVAELDAAVQALRGYAGNVRSVNERVEKRADGALATVESLEHRIEELEAALQDPAPHSRESADAADTALAAEWSTNTTRHGAEAARQRPPSSSDDGDPYTIPTPEQEPDEGGLVARIREVL